MRVRHDVGREPEEPGAEAGASLPAAKGVAAGPAGVRQEPEPHGGVAAPAGQGLGGPLVGLLRQVVGVGAADEVRAEPPYVVLSGPDEVAAATTSVSPEAQAGTENAASSTDNDTGTDGLSVAALVIAGLALLTAIGALLRGRGRQTA